MQGGSGENGEIEKRDQGEIAFLGASDQLDNTGEGFQFKNRDGSVDFADPKEVEIMGFGTHMDQQKGQNDIRDETKESEDGIKLGEERHAY